jgi:two-component system sensor kinase FixL
MQRQAPPAVAEHLDGLPVDAVGHRRRWAAWLVGLRWFAGLGAALGVAGALWLERVAPGAGWPLWGVVLGLALVCAVLVSRIRADSDALADERERLQTIIDSMADAVLFVTPDGVVRLRNTAARQIWPEGSPPDVDLRACLSAQRWDALAGPSNRTGPWSVYAVLAVRGRHFEARWSPVAGPDGRPRGAMMVARDITERVARQTHRMQAERMAAVGRLASGLAHELDGPLGDIARFTQHALDAVRPGDALADHLGAVLHAASHCQTIVRDLVADARRLPPERRDVSVAELLGGAERILSPRAAACGATLYAEVEPGTPETVLGDADQLRQALVNLGLDALQAIGTRRGTVCLSAAPVPGRPGAVRLGVVDDGPGIPPEERAGGFEPFHTRRGEGTGLGLTVAADIVQAHGGQLHLDAADGCGCSFSFVVGPPERLPDQARATEVPSEAHG